MNNPDGYTALDLVGYTDQGDYNATKSYVANDLVHYGGSIWCCLIDDTVGITPTEGVNWRFWVENSQKGISDIVNVLGAKNLIPYPYLGGDSVTKNGIMFTVNADKSITASGTATATTVYNIAQSNEICESGKQYKINGCPSGGSNSTYRLETYESDASSQTAGIDIGAKPGGTLFTSEGKQQNVRIVIYPAAGEVSLTFYPMIRPSGIEDATYVPPTKTNKELTEEVTQNSSDIQTLTNQVKDMNNVYGSKNLLLNNAVTQVKNGITFTVNSDGSIRLTGTATDSTYIDLPVDLTDGVTYTASGISGGSATTYQIHLQTADGASTNAGSFVNGEKTFTKNSGQASPNNYDVHRYRIRVSSGATVDTVIYPMIRLASITDDTYVPYAMTNRELTLSAIKSEVLTITTSGTGNASSTIGVDDRWCIAAQAGNLIITPWLNSSNYWAFRVLNADGTVHANQTVTFRYFYIPVNK